MSHCALDYIGSIDFGKSSYLVTELHDYFFTATFTQFWSWEVEKIVVLFKVELLVEFSLQKCLQNLAFCMLTDVQLEEGRRCSSFDFDWCNSLGSCWLWPNVPKSWLMRSQAGPTVLLQPIENIVIPTNHKVGFDISTNHRQPTD